MIISVTNVDIIRTVEHGALRHNETRTVRWIGNERLKLVILHCDCRSLRGTVRRIVYDKQTIRARYRIHLWKIESGFAALAILKLFIVVQ
jgi:hypothetical protein